MAAGLMVPSVDAKALTTVLQAYARANRDLSPTMRLVAEDLVTAVSDQFETAGGGNWQGLAASTIRRRRASGLGAQILKDTGRFAASISPYWGPDFAEAATDVSYAVFHVSDAPRSKIPLRNPFDLPESVYDDAARTIVEGLKAP